MLALLLALAPDTWGATVFPRPPADVGLIGAMAQVEARRDQTLLDLARAHHLGYEEMLLANPDVDPWLPGQGTKVTLPTRYILPRAPRRGLVLNVPEMRIYYYPASESDQAEVRTYPVSVGRMDWATPLGTARIVAKVPDPAWRPPESIRAEAAARGEPLPEVVPAGPSNPLGRFALRLSVPGYLIHGTNKPWGIGMRVTHGCLRLYPEDIESLFHAVPVDTPVEIVNQPVKLGWLADTLYLEVHPPLEEDQAGRDSLMRTALDLVHAEVLLRRVRLSGRRLNQAVEEQRGYPVPISLPDEGR